MTSPLRASKTKLESIQCCDGGANGQNWGDVVLLSHTEVHSSILKQLSAYFHAIINP